MYNQRGFLMSDLNVKVNVELDDNAITNLKKSLEKSYNLSINTKEIDNIASKLQKTFDKSYDIKINTNDIQKQVSVAINSGLKNVSYKIDGIQVKEKYWENIFKNQFTDRYTKSNTLS